MADAEQSRPWVGQDSRARQEWYERQLRHARMRGHAEHPETEAAPESPGLPGTHGLHGSPGLPGSAGLSGSPEPGRPAADASPPGRSVDGGPPRRPGSDGERRLQQRLGTAERAERFYDEQVLDRLNERMREFIGRQEMFFLATSDASGECDSSFRAGPAGFLQVLDERTLAFPEYRGNGVHASLGNIQENPHLGILMIDFTRARIGLHVNGRATIVEDAEMRAWYPHLPEDSVPGRRAQLWVQVEVEEAYIHCAKHIPQLQKAPRRTARDWGTDDYKRKGGDFFGVARDRRQERAAAGPSAVPEPALSVVPELPDADGPTEGPGSPEAPGAPGAHEVPEPAAPRTPEPFAPAASAAPEPGPDASLFGDPPAPVPEQQPSVPAQRRAPDRRLADVSIASNASLFFGSVASAASADTREARTAGQRETTPRAEQPYAFDMSGSDPRAWREEAERALAEAQRRGAMSDAGSFGGWFG